MKKVLIVSLVLVLACASLSLAAVKKVYSSSSVFTVGQPQNTPVENPISYSLKGGLAGGAFRIAGTIDRKIGENCSVGGEIGYGVGNGYNVYSLGISCQHNFKSNVYVGLEASYSGYSNAITLGIPSTNITDLNDVGVGLFVGMKRDRTYGQIGYDTRLGAIAEAGYLVRM